MAAHADPMQQTSDILRAHAALPKGPIETLMNDMWQLPAPGKEGAGKEAVASLLTRAEGLAGDAAGREADMLAVATTELRRRLQWTEPAPVCASDSEGCSDTEEEEAEPEVVSVDVGGSRVLTEHADGSAVMWDAQTGAKVRTVHDVSLVDTLRRAAAILEDEQFEDLPSATRVDAVVSAQRLFNTLTEEDMIANLDVVRRFGQVLRLRIATASRSG
eukprot:TRINITY_DN2331_c0_g1_i1.p1 TRINITY_DN2331_c0_g1~~TRINITY_DN2331_c0_g1_i1.p1  ORF type:complete len:244 (+),score=94.24 TRINITY_DN2331_c0_g1_i1:82-732(+)